MLLGRLNGEAIPELSRVIEARKPAVAIGRF